MMPCPWDIFPITEAFWWHPIHRADPAHIWLRTILKKAAAVVTADTTAPA